jgi:hypothetical protein
MARTHEVPNHLNVQDTLFLGLTARQVATLMAFASPAYGIWDQLTIAPLPVRGSLAGLLVLAAPPGWSAARRVDICPPGLRRVAAEFAVVPTGG